MNTDNGIQQERNQSTASKKWEAFAERLASTLSDLSDGEFLVFCKSGTRLFIQFAAERDGMRAEAVSNQYLEPSLRLSPEALRHLRSLGWQAPTYIHAEVLEEPAEGSSNNYVNVPAPASFRGLADLAVRTFREVFDVIEPAEMHYRGYSSQYDSVRFPRLGIKRRDILDDDFEAMCGEISNAELPANQLPLSMNVLPC